MYKEKHNFSDSQIKKNFFLEEWKRIEKIKKGPDNFKNIITIEHKEFVSEIFEQDSSFVKIVFTPILKNVVVFPNFKLKNPKTLLLFA